jgi:hypothetical protein
MQREANLPADNESPRIHRWARRIVEGTLARADIVLDGTRPWDPRIHRPRVFARILSHGTLGLGESYMDGDWDVPALDELATRLLSLARPSPPTRAPPISQPWHPPPTSASATGR